MSSLRRAVRSVAPPTCVRRAGRPPPACHVLTAGSLAHHEPPPLCARCLVYVGVRSWPLRRAQELPDIGASLRCSCSPLAASFVPRASSSGGVPSFSPFAGFRGVPVFHAFAHRHPTVCPLSAQGETPNGIAIHPPQVRCVIGLVTTCRLASGSASGGLRSGGGVSECVHTCSDQSDLNRAGRSL